MRSKARLTITLPSDLLAEIDRLIDKQKVRNRSHAIELLLRESLKPTVSTAVLLAGGSSETEQLPAMLPVQELEYSAFRHSLAALEEEFEMRGEPVHVQGNGRPVKPE